MALGQKEIGKRVSEFTLGVANNASDMMLFAIKYNLDFSGSQAISEIGFSSLKRSLIHLKSKGFITESAGTSTGYSLTEKGALELEKIIPSYKEERVWNGKLYLINYDLPVTKNTIRNSFRDFLKTIGCGMIQHSVWLTANDPRSKLMEYITKENLPRELVIVSSINLEVELYPYQVPNLLEQAFKLSSLNQRYKDYLLFTTAEDISREQKIFAFLKILKDDPQAPYDLIPGDWSGYEAYEIFKKIV